MFQHQKRWNARSLSTPPPQEPPRKQTPLTPPTLSHKLPLQTHQFKHQRDAFDSQAREWTRQHATQQAQAADRTGDGGSNGGAPTTAQEVQKAQTLAENEQDNAKAGDEALADAPQSSSEAQQGTKRPLLPETAAAAAARPGGEENLGASAAAGGSAAGPSTAPAVVAKKSKLSMRR